MKKSPLRFFLFWAKKEKGIAERYVMNKLVGSTVLVSLCFLGLFWFFGVLDRLAFVGVADYGIKALFITSLLELPSRLYMVLPITALIGVLVALSGLLKTSELIVLRVSGVSPTVLTKWIASFGLYLGFLGLFLGSVVVPWTQQVSTDLTKIALRRTLIFDLKTGVWLKENYLDAEKLLNGVSEDNAINLRFVNVGGVDQQKTLQRIKIYEFSPQFELERMVEANKATFTDKGWVLEGVRGVSFSVSLSEPLSKSMFWKDRLFWATNLTEDLVIAGGYQIETLSLINLWQQRKHLNENGQDSSSQTLTFWKKMLYPLSLLSLLLWALPFSLGTNIRSLNLAARVFLGAMLGLVFFALYGLLGYVAVLQSWPIFWSFLIFNIGLITLVLWGSRIIQRK